MLCNLRNSIYQDRRNKAALCYDFPADRVMIEGLERMQQHFLNRGSGIEIPVVRVMNTAHFLATYMLNTPCAEQGDYDRMIDHDIRERVLVPIVLIALVAMLKRTDGKQAKTCRAILMENRSEDFYEGVSLYEQWLSGAIERYDEEAFYIDVMDEINSLREQTEQLIKENVELKIKIKNMSKEERPIIHVAGNYIAEQHIDIHDNNNCNIYATEAPREQSQPAETRSSFPAENDYISLVAWLEKQKSQGVDYYAESGYNRSKMCRELSDIVGWIVDQNSLRKAQNR